MDCVRSRTLRWRDQGKIPSGMGIGVEGRGIREVEVMPRWGDERNGRGGRVDGRERGERAWYQLIPIIMTFFLNLSSH